MSIQRATDCACREEDHYQSGDICYGCGEVPCDYCRWSFEFTVTDAAGDLAALRAALDGSGPRVGDSYWDATYWPLLNLERWVPVRPDVESLRAQLSDAREAYDQSSL